MDSFLQTYNVSPEQFQQLLEQTKAEKYVAEYFDEAILTSRIAIRKQKVKLDTEEKISVLNTKINEIKGIIGLKSGMDRRKLQYKMETLLNRIIKVSNVNKRLLAEFDSDVISYTSMFSAIRSINGNKFPVTDGVEEIMQLTSRLMKYPRSVVLDIYASVRWNVDKMKKLYGYIPEIPKELIDPPPYDTTSFNYDTTWNRPMSPKFRYLPNFNVKEFIERFGFEIPTLKDCSENNMLRSIRATHLMLRDYTNEARALYLHKVMFGLLEGTISNDTSYTIDPTFSLPLYMIHLLHQDYEDFPYLEVGNKMQWNVKVKVSSMLPTLTYCLLNLQIHLVLGNISFEQCAIACDVYMQWAKISLNQEHLEHKSKYTGPIKLLHEKVHDIQLPIYAANGLITGVEKSKYSQEVWFEDEKEQLIAKLKETLPVFQSYFNKLLSKGFKDVPALINEVVGISIIANPGNFKKTVPILEMDKSVDPRTNAPVMFPVPIQEYGGKPYKYSFDNVKGISKIWNEFKILLPRMREQVGLVNIESEYFDRITNKSAGRQIDDALRATLPRGLLPLTKQRLIQALLTIQEFYDEALFKAKVLLPGQIGKREQNDRRERMIEVVNNLVQVLAIIGYKVGEILSDVIDDLAYGKQIGNIKDMALQLKASADQDSYISSIDISGADASTQRPLTMLMFLAACEIFDDYRHSRYFWAKEKEVQMKDIRTNIISSVKLNPIQVMVTEILPLLQQVDFKLNDGVFGTETPVNGLIFWSGLFNTAGQHNFVIALLLRAVQREWLAKSLKNYDAVLQVSGDDIMKIFRQIDDEYLMPYVKMELDALETIGFKSDPELSRFSGVFLQQVARFGRVSPLPARLSVICSEKGESVNKSLLEQFSEIQSVFTELATRSKYPENWMSMMRGMFNASRVVLYETNRVKPEYMAKFENKLSGDKDMSRFILRTDQGLSITYPYVSLFIPEGIGSPFPGLVTKYIDLLPASHLMPIQSDIQNLILRKAYSKNKYHDDPKLLLKVKQKIFLKRRKKIREYGGLPPDAVNSNELWTPQFWLVDHDELRNHGWIFAQFICKIDVKERLLERREADIGSVWVSNLVSKLESTQDQDKLASSHKADHRLKLAGIFVKDSLLYYRSAQERIRNSIMELPETDAEYNDISNYLIGKLLTYSGMYQQSVNEGMYSVIMKWSRDDRELTDDYIFNKKIVLTPGLHEGSESERILSATKFALSKVTGGVMVYSKFDKSKFRNLQIEDIVIEGAKVYKANEHMIETYFEAINLPNRFINDVRSLIIEAAQFGISGFKTVLQPRRYFVFNTHPMAFMGAIDDYDVPDSRKTLQMRDYRLVVGRDFLLSYGHLSKKKISLLIEPETKEVIRGGPVSASF